MSRFKNVSELEQRTVLSLKFEAIENPSLRYSAQVLDDRGGIAYVSTVCEFASHGNETVYTIKPIYIDRAATLVASQIVNHEGRIVAKPQPFGTGKLHVRGGDILKLQHTFSTND